MYTSLQAKNNSHGLESGLQPANSQKYYGDLKGPVVTTVRIQVLKEDSLNKKNLMKWQTNHTGIEEIDEKRKCMPWSFNDVASASSEYPTKT